MQLYSGLVAHSPQMEVIPDVARRWEILDSGRKYIFHLRDDVYWSDGAPVTAHDFEYTFKRALDPATQAPCAGLLLYDVRGAKDFHQGRTSDPGAVGVHALDDHTLVFELEVPTSYFMQDLSYYVLVPVPRHVVESCGARWTEPENIVTNGPFRLSAWERGESIRLERNPDYHGRTVQLERIDLSLNEAPADLLAAYDEPVVAQWRDRLAVPITVKVAPPGAMADPPGGKLPQSYFGLWVTDYPDPDCFLRVWVEDDRPVLNWRHAGYDHLIETARRITDQVERMRHYQQAEQILADEVPILPLVYSRVHVLLKPWVKNYRLALMKQQYWKDIRLDAR